MSSELDHDIEGGRLRRVGWAQELDDAVPLGQVLELLSTLPASRAGYPTFPPGGGGGGGGFPVSPGGGPGLTFSNANNVSFGTMGNAVVTAIAAVGVSAGGSTITATGVSFSNANGVSFGLNGNTITASISPAAGGSINVSAGTTSNNLTAVTFSNSNGVSFGINNSTITASVSQSNQTLGFYFSSQTTGQSSSSTFDARSVTFRGMGIVSVGASAGEVIISVPAGGGALTAINVSAGTTSNNLSAITFSNSNNVSFGLNGSTITASATVASTQGSINLSAGTTSNLSSAFTFSNSNGVSFGLNAGTITASVASQTVQTIGLYASSNTTGQSSSSTYDARSITIRGAGIASVGNSAGEFIISVPSAGALINFSAGTTSNNLGSVVFSDSNNVSFGLNGSTITATVTVATSLTAINVSAGTTSNNLSAITFSNSNGISFGLNASTLTASYASQVTAFSQFADFATNFSISNATLSLQKVSLPAYVTATRAAFLMDLTGNSNSTGALTISMAVYTLTGSTASIASSASRQLSWTTGSQTTASSIYGGNSGTRYRTLAINLTLTPGDYLFAWHFRTTNNGTWRIFGRPAASIVGALDANETNYWLDGTSVSSFTTAMPASINVTDTNYARTGAAALRQPGVILIGTF